MVLQGGLVALQGVLVTPKESWWPLWCSHGVWWPYRGAGGPTGGFGGPKGALVATVVPCEVWWLYREVGGPTRVLVALQGGLVTPKDLWWPLWYSHELRLPYKGFGGPTGGFGDPKGVLVATVVSL